MPDSSFHFLLSILLIGAFASQSDYSMVVTYGAPTISWDPQTIPADSWDTCVRICYLDTYCVMAHQTPDFCHHYQVRKVYAAERLTAENQSLIAIKANKSTSEPCDASLNVISQTIYLPKNPTYPKASQRYELKLSGNNFTLDYLVTGYCTSGWQLFFRPTAAFCLTVSTNMNVLYNYTDALWYCNKAGGTLAGFETLEETSWVTTIARRRLTNDSINIGLWVSGERKPSCLLASDGSKPACAGLGGFNFTDKYLQTMSGYQWDAGQPDSYVRKYMQNCISEWIMGNTDDYKHGKIDDNDCNFETGPRLTMRGYVCGMVAPGT